MNRLLNLMFLTLFFSLASCNQETLLDLTPFNENVTASQNGNANQDVASSAITSNSERVVVANRGSGDITVIDAANNTVINTYVMPDGGEPMYAVHIPSTNAVYVGDRANDRVVIFDENDFSVIGTVDCGAGVFHMWASPNGSNLFVNNDIDNTTTVINTNSLRVKGTVATPADLVSMGGKPHDVFVDPTERYAYISVLGVAGPNDYVVQYDMSNPNNYVEIGRVAVGKDPHLFADDVNNKLYVACQNTNEVVVVNRTTLAVESSIPFTGSHGIFMPKSGDYLYVADIAGGQLATFDVMTEAPVGTPLTTPVGVPHNLTINDAEDKLFVSHSGPTADQVTIYDLSPDPVFSMALTAGTNPFGILYYSY